jgi:hypothetical protein
MQKLLTFATHDGRIALYALRSGETKTFSEVGSSPIFHPDGKRIFYIQNNRWLCSVNIDGTERRIVREGFFDYLVRFSKDGGYLLYAGGGAIMIPPGHEYSTLEILDVAKLNTYQIFRGGVLCGASWVE